jgi:uncharacterized protein YggE
MMNRLLFVLLALPFSAFAQTGLPSQPYLYVTGQAAIEKPADIAFLHFDVVARNAEQTKANQDVQAKAKKILALLDERKITKADIIAEDLKSDPQYEETNSGKHSKIIGYRVTRSFNVKVHDLPAFGKLVDELLAIAGVEFSNINGSLSDEKQVQEELWEKALADARDRAEKTARVLGVKIDSVFAASRVAFPRIAVEMFGSPDDEAGRERVVVTGAPEYVLGPFSVSENVHVIYLVSPAK